MAVAGGVLWTALVRLSISGEIVVVRREQAQVAACDDGSNDALLDRLIAGETLRLTERKLAQFRAWEETA